MCDRKRLRPERGAGSPTRQPRWGGPPEGSAAQPRRRVRASEGGPREPASSLQFGFVRVGAKLRPHTAEHSHQPTPRGRVRRDDRHRTARASVRRDPARAAHDRRRPHRVRDVRSRDLQRDGDGARLADADERRVRVRDHHRQRRALHVLRARHPSARVRGHDLRAADDEPTPRVGARGAAAGVDHRSADRLPQPQVPRAGDVPRAAAAQAVQPRDVAAVHRHRSVQGDQRLARPRRRRSRAPVRGALPEAPHPGSRLRVSLGRRRVPRPDHLHGRRSAAEGGDAEVELRLASCLRGLHVFASLTRDISFPAEPASTSSPWT